MCATREHAAQNVGLSHNVMARTARHGDETVFEAITTVQSIDWWPIHLDRGLFEPRIGTDRMGMHVRAVLA